MSARRGPAGAQRSRRCAYRAQRLRRRAQLAHHTRQRLGGNTGYVIHPEETMVDNVAMLATGRTVPNPALLKRIEAVLRA